MRLVQTFDQLDLIAPIPDEPEVYDYTEKDGKNGGGGIGTAGVERVPLIPINRGRGRGRDGSSSSSTGVDRDWRDNQTRRIERKPLTLKSRVKPGVTVMLYANQAYDNRIPLNSYDVATVDAIYREIPQLASSHRETMKNLFWNPFTVTIEKNDITNDGLEGSFSRSRPSSSKSGTKSGSDNNNTESFRGLYDLGNSLGSRGGRMEKDTDGKVGFSNDSTGGGGNKGRSYSDAQEPLQTLESATNSIQMDYITEKVIKEHWLTFLRSAEEWRLKYGFFPFFFRPESIEIPEYTASPKKPARKHRRRRSSSRRGDDGINEVIPEEDNRDFVMYRESVDGSGPKIRTNLKGLTVSEDYADRAATEKNPSPSNKNPTLTDEMGLKFATKVKWSKKKGPDMEDVLKNSMTGRLQEMKTDVTEFLGGPSLRYGANNVPGDYMNDPITGIPKSGETIVMEVSESVGGKGKVTFENGGPLPTKNYYVDGERGDKRLKRVTEEAMEEKKKDNEANLKVIKEQLAIQQGTVEEDEGVKLGAKKRKRYEAFVSSDGESEYSDDEGSYSDDDDGNEEEDDGSGPLEIKKIHTYVIHQIPTCPDPSEGEISVYSDNGARYVWTWKINDGYRDCPEPFMGFVVHTDATTQTGRLNSPVSGLIESYKEVERIKQEQESSQRAKEVPFYVIQKDQPKAAGKGDDVEGMNTFEPMVPTSSMGGSGYPSNYHGPTDSSVYAPSYILNPAVMLARDRDVRSSTMAKHLAARYHLPGDIPNGTPSWDYGSLYDRTSDAFRHAVPWVGGSSYGYGGVPYPSPNRFPGAFPGEWAGTQYANRAGLYGGRRVGGGGIPLNMWGRGGGYDPGMYQTYAIGAQVTSNTIGRTVTQTPMGVIAILPEGEKLTKVENSGDGPNSKNSAWLEAMSNLNWDASFVGGSPNGAMMGRGQSGKRGTGAVTPEGNYTSKSDSGGSAKGGYPTGLRVTQQSQTATKEHTVNNWKYLSRLWGECIADLFSISYAPTFASNEDWYFELVRNSFTKEFDNFKARGRRGSGKNLGTMPTLKTFYKVKVMMPTPGIMDDLPAVLDFYRLGFRTAEEVFLALNLNCTDPPIGDTDCIKMFSRSKRMTVEERFKMFSERLEQLRERDEEAAENAVEALKPQPKEGAGGSKPKAKAKKKK